MGKIEITSGNTAAWTGTLTTGSTGTWPVTTTERVLLAGEGLGRGFAQVGYWPEDEDIWAIANKRKEEEDMQKAGYLTRLIVRTKADEARVDELDAIIANADWQTRLMLYLLLQHPEITPEALGYIQEK